MTTLRWCFVVMVAAAAVAAVGCGGDDVDGGSAAEGTTATVETPTADELGRHADDVEQIVEREVRDLSDVRSRDDLSEELGDARSQLDEKADEIERADVEAELEDERDALESATRDLSAELADIEERVDANDLGGAFDELRDLEAVREVEDAIARIRE